MGKPHVFRLKALPRTRSRHGRAVHAGWGASTSLGLRRLTGGRAVRRLARGRQPGKVCGAGSVRASTSVTRWCETHAVPRDKELITFHGKHP